jgi:hypothetical protein
MSPQEDCSTTSSSGTHLVVCLGHERRDRLVELTKLRDPQAMCDHPLRRVERSQQARMVRLSEEVDVELQTPTLDVRTGEDAIAPPIHDCSPRGRVRCTASLDELLETAKQRYGLRLFPLEI